MPLIAAAAICFGRLPLPPVPVPWSSRPAPSTIVLTVGTRLPSPLRQRRWITTSIDEVHQRKVGVLFDHPWSGKTHHLAHLFSGIGTVAVNGAIGASRFVGSVGATVEAPIGVVCKDGALIAQNSRSVMVGAIDLQHRAHRRALSPDASSSSSHTWRLAFARQIFHDPNQDPPKAAAAPGGQNETTPRKRKFCHSEHFYAAFGGNSWKDRSACSCR